MFNLISRSDDSTLAMPFNFTQFLRYDDYDAAKMCSVDIDVMRFKKIVMPVHTTGHWSCAAIDMEKKQIFYYDSLKRENHVRQIILYD